jgi:hypothetical protein
MSLNTSPNGKYIVKTTTTPPPELNPSETNPPETNPPETCVKTVWANHIMKPDEYGQLVGTGLPLEGEMCAEQSFTVIKYLYITIYKTDGTIVHTFKQSTQGPRTEQMIKQFVVIDGVTWFIGMLNYMTVYFVNCETGITYTAPEDKYTTWRYMLAISPNGHYIVVSTYSLGGNWDYKKVYNISKIDTDGAIITFIGNVPADVDLEDDMVMVKFTGRTETEIKIIGYSDINNEQYDVGVFNVAVK